MPARARVIVIGLDGLDPAITETLMRRGALPGLAALERSGGFGRIATTTPAQTPVAWSTFATGVNPGGHGIFDFLRRDPADCLPNLALNRYEQKNAFLPPKAVNLRGGTPIWETLTEVGVPSTILRCPCTYPPDRLQGRMLSGMGVPDLRGGLGTATLYTTEASASAGESEQVVPVTLTDGEVRGHLIGPRQPRGGNDLRCAFTLQVEGDGAQATLHSDGQPHSLPLTVGRWSNWLRVRFKAGLLQSTAGLVQFLLLRTRPVLELYASPVNFDPVAPAFPISEPWEYGTELSRAIGDFATLGMVEDHRGLDNARFSEAEYLAHCEQTMQEREAMLAHELNRFQDGLLYCLFDTPDRIQHMFWRFREPEHPANRAAAASGGTPGDDPACRAVIEEHYRRCDRVAAHVLEAVGDDATVVVLSDHGFTSFQRGIHLNAWLAQEGLLTLQDGVSPGEEAGEFFHRVDWSRTQAYALGIGGIYLNLRGREARGIVDPAGAEALANRIAKGLTGLPDPARGRAAIRSVGLASRLYSGPYAAQAPDLVINAEAGYRASWTTALGGIPAQLFEDNTRRWSGDHIVDPALVPGVLFMNRPFRTADARLLDMAPTILEALGVAPPAILEGASLLT